MEQERQKFMEIEKHIKTLQKQEMQALENWKKIIYDEEYEFSGLKKLEINEAHGWID